MKFHSIMFVCDHRYCKGKTEAVGVVSIYRGSQVRNLEFLHFYYPPCKVIFHFEVEPNSAWCVWDVLLVALKSCILGNL